MPFDVFGNHKVNQKKSYIYLHTFVSKLCVL